MTPTHRSPWSRIAFLLGTGFGVGYFPFVPGTIGSLWGLGLVRCVQWTTDKPAAQAVFALIMFLLGIAICASCIRRFGTNDPQQVVFDEIAAFTVVFLFTEMNRRTAIFGFIYFRIFDILKPWPIKQLEKLPGGLGVMADDYAAGVYAAAALILTERVFDMFA